MGDDGGTERRQLRNSRRSRLGFPCVIDEAGNYSIVQGLDFTEEGKARIAKTTEELLKERQAVKRFFA